MNPIDLKETTMDISTRKLLKVVLSEYNQDEDYILLDNLMGKETEVRKELIREMQEEV